MPSIVNRFGELTRAIAQTINRRTLHNTERDIAADIGEIYFERLRQHTPHRTAEYWTGHDHTSIEQGWIPPRVVTQPDSARIIIGNKSEHVEFQRFGAAMDRAGYKIPFNAADPSQKALQFRWPTTIDHGVPPHTRYSKEVFHPGFRPWGDEDFAVRAADAALPGAEARLKENRPSVWRFIREILP